MNDKRILTIANHLGSIGGTESAQLAIFQGLAEREWEIDLLYVSAGDLWPEWQKLAASTTQIRASLPSRSDPIRSTVGAVKAALLAGRARPSAIYVHNVGDVPIALAAGRLSGAPVLVHLHLPPPIRQPIWLSSLVHRTTAVIAPSSDAAKHWMIRASLDPARISVVPLGIDVERFVPLNEDERAAVRSSIGVGEHEPMVLYAGRIERIKGAHFLIEAIGRIPEPPRLVLCGAAQDGDYLADLTEASKGISASFLGRRPDVHKLMAAADLVVLPSNWLETQGLVISEAMACGTPVVASRIGGLTETMKGFPDQLVPPGQVEPLTTAIEQYINWKRSDPDLGRRSRAWVVENLSLDTSIDALEAVIVRSQGPS
jgi:glycosyltransferase involved in cell wall biosynthesis